MKKSDLKQIIKPLVKECIHEVLLEEGLLSNVVSEVAKGLQAQPIVESYQPPEEVAVKRQMKQSNRKLKEYKENLMKSMGESAYNGVNLFEGTDPIQESQPQKGHSDLGNPHDAGVDISSMMGNSAAIWQALK